MDNKINKIFFIPRIDLKHLIVILFYPDHLDSLADFKHYSVEPNSCQRPCNVV